MSESVYRLFDAGGDLLYIGRSNNVERRILQHRQQQPWGSSISRWSTVDYPTRQDAHQAEQRAICAEDPTYNKLRWVSPDGPLHRKTEGERPHVTFKIDQDVASRLREDAAANGRTVSQSIRLHLRRALGMAA